jgi:uncharacterized membrane protein YraQ (UPF0718 family)
MSLVLEQWLHIFLESAPWLVLGFGLAGLSKVFIDSDKWLGRGLARKGLPGAALAALVGAPLPLCSCSVLPAAIGLRRQGASRASTASFLVSVPETDVVSVMITWGLLGPIMAIARPVAAIFTALGTGWMVETFAPEPEKAPDAEAPESCCAPPEPEPESCCAPAEPKQRPVWRRALDYGYVEFLDDMSGPLLVGILLAGLVGAAAASLDLERYFGVPIAGYLVALAVGIPTYVCATASTPVAVGMLAAGMSPGAVLVFLLAGPATNVASFVVLGRELGRRGLLVYLLAIAVGSVAFGLVFDLAFGQDLGAVEAAPMAHHSVSVVQVASAVVLGLLLLASGIRKRWIVGRFLAR